MTIYLLKKREGVETGGEFGIFGYDNYQGFVVRAASDDDARRIASESAHGGQSEENITAWLNPELTTCEAIEPDGEGELILADFHHG